MHSSPLAQTSFSPLPGWEEHDDPHSWQRGWSFLTPGIDVTKCSTLRNSWIGADCLGLFSYKYYSVLCKVDFFFFYQIKYMICLVEKLSLASGSSKLLGGKEWEKYIYHFTWFSWASFSVLGVLNLVQFLSDWHWYQH